jgi:hypothetical protein
MQRMHRDGVKKLLPQDATCASRRLGVKNLLHRVGLEKLFTRWGLESLLPVLYRSVAKWSLNRFSL